MLRRRPIAVLVIASLLAPSLSACRSDEVFSLMSDSTFVQTMRELRRLPVGLSANPTVRAYRRDSILASYGITAAELESTTVRLARDPARAVAVWRAIESDLFAPP